MSEKEINKKEEILEEEKDTSKENQSQEEIEETEESETTSVEDEISELNEKLEELEDQNLRLQAEIANMRRINQRERQEAAKYRSQNLATSLLDVIDNLERALETQVESDDAKALSEGVEMVYSQLIAAFEKEDITVIDPIGEDFDPNYHQAVSTIPASEENPENTVANVLQKGYLLVDRVIRPAMVIVAQ